MSTKSKLTKLPRIAITRSIQSKRALHNYHGGFRGQQQQNQYQAQPGTFFQGLQPNTNTPNQIVVYQDQIIIPAQPAGCRVARVLALGTTDRTIAKIVRLVHPVVRQGSENEHLSRQLNRMLAQHRQPYHH
jgi:hypothetical protein